MFIEYFTNTFSKKVSNEVRCTVKKLVESKNTNVIDYIRDKNIKIKHCKPVESGYEISFFNDNDFNYIIKKLKNKNANIQVIGELKIKLKISED